LKSFRVAPSMVTRHLVAHKLDTPDASGRIVIDPERWYPLDAWIQVCDSISKDIGPNATFECGKMVAESVQVPPHVRDLRGLMEFMDAGYHLHHRKNGVVMFDLATGKQLDGIGHYLLRPAPATEPRLVMECENPYPCDFDLGLLGGAARRFEPRSRTFHDDKSPCRKKGGSACTYITTW
jgi:hypothetical protein